MKNLIKYGGDFDSDNKLKRIDEIKNEMSKSDFWNDSVSAENKASELNQLNDVIKPLLSLKTNLDILNNYEELLDVLDDNLEKEYNEIYFKTKQSLASLEVLTYLNGEFDNKPAIFEIHAGAGGTESCDWVAMLSRMYSKYFERKGYNYKIIDEQPGEETGLKSIVYLIEGPYAYGYLKNEKGVHRLVRLSPFDANNRRHTSFAAVDVIPEFDEAEKIDLKDQEIRIDVYRSSGAGGQGVNTTDSAVRVTHIPSGIVVTCQNERSQIKNKETALSVLKSKLYQLKLREKQDKIDSIKAKNVGIEFGSQIRSYVLHPYSMVKDHRTNYETSNVNKVLDGNLDEFIESNLKGDK